MWSAGLWFWRNLCTKTTQSIRVLAGGRPLHPSPALPGPGALPRVGRLPRRRPGPLLCPDFSEVQAASMGRPRAKLSKSRETADERGSRPARQVWGPPSRPPQQPCTVPDAFCRPAQSPAPGPPGLLPSARRRTPQEAQRTRACGAALFQAGQRRLSQRGVTPETPTPAHGTQTATKWNRETLFDWV